MIIFAYQFAGMKAIFSAILLSSFFLFSTSAQTTQAKEPFALAAVTTPHKLKGKVNYLLALSKEDFQNKQYVFYTDSNARVAHITINGKDIRLTGGPNAEHIMAYAGGGYTITLSNPGAVSGNTTDNKGNLTSVTTLVIYNKMGQTIVKQVTGNQVK